MSTYLIELYLPHGLLTGFAAELRAAAGAGSDGGVNVSYALAIAVPEDEVGFCLVEAPSPDVARGLAERAQLQVVRVASAIVDQSDGGR